MQEVTYSSHTVCDQGRGQQAGTLCHHPSCLGNLPTNRFAGFGRGFCPAGLSVWLRKVSPESRLLPGQKTARTRDNYRHHLKMEIKLGSLHQEVYFTLIIQEGKGALGSTGWPFFQIRCFGKLNIGRAFPLASSKQHTISMSAVKAIVIFVICYYLDFEQN